MAIINTETPLLSLESWRRIIAYHPWHFWGLADNTIIPVTSSCNDILYKHAYQNTDAVGRNEIIEAIKAAEGRFAQELGFWPAPKHFIETHPFPKYHDRGVWNIGQGDPQFRWLNQKMKWGHIEAVGVQTLTSLGTARLTFTDTDGDGLYETFTSDPVATTVTNENLIWAVFNSTDRLDNDLANWRIDPVYVTISGGTVTVKGNKWQVVRPILYEGFAVDEIDPAVGANFAANLEIYVVSTNPDGTTYDTSQAALIWETPPYPSWACSDCGSLTGTNSSDPAAVAYGVARAGIRHAEMGIIYLGSAAYNTTAAVWEAINWGICRPPERMAVRYRAGYPLSNGVMDKRMQVAVARLAAAELARPICACDEANRELYRWQFDLARTSGANDEGYGLVSADDLNNPFGTRRGHVYAWRVVKEFRNLIGLSY